jgi:acyl-coenzyme A synthetase/AMP-(fatty) acid ligase
MLDFASPRSHVVYILQVIQNVWLFDIPQVSGETGAQLTYGQLQTQIVKTGSALVRQGFTKGDVMMMIAPNCTEFIIMYMAASSIGMIVSAVNPMYTKGNSYNICILI